jgi:ribosomal protein S18 acetylase RimI-like enzyme
MGLIMRDRRASLDTPETRLRRATEEDLAEVIRIWQEGWADAHVGHVPEGLMRYRQSEHFEALAGERLGSMWVAESGGSIAGFVVTKGDEVEQLYVDRAHRGTDVAARLLRHGEAEVVGSGYTSAWLAVVAGNARARAFYARLGWIDAGPMIYRAQTADG